MSMLVDVPQTPSQKHVEKAAGPLVTGAWQRIAVSAWAVIFLLALLCAVLSIASLNIWDRVPASQAGAYFPNLTPDFVTEKVTFQAEIQRMGISLAFFANALTLFRIIGSLALFALSALLVRRYPRHLMGILFAAALAVMGAAGLWQDPMLFWSTLLAPWMEIVAQLLNLLLWFGLIFLYAFPDGRFTPRWTAALVVLLIPMVISMVFDLPIFFNPGTWPDPLPLLPNLVFIGAAFFSVLYRYRKAQPEQKARLRGYVLGVSLLMTLYFLMFFLFDVYTTLTGERILKTYRDVTIEVLIAEPMWFLSEAFFALGTARSLFRDRLLEG